MRATPDRPPLAGRFDRRCLRVAAAAGLAWLLSVTAALAQPQRLPVNPMGPAAEASVPAPHSRLRNTMVFLAGTAAGLGAHEGGHLIAGFAFGAHPSVQGIRYAGIPFFAIGHDPVSRRREYVVSAAGFWEQYLSSEWIFEGRQNFAAEDAPFLKGMFAFHLGASVMYGIAAFGQLGPPQRDTLGLAVTLGPTGVREPLIGALVFTPAALDAYRYLAGDRPWAKWASRGIKLASVALVLEAGRAP